ncbi:MAG: hypothetical protein ACFFAH_14165 [Promethearchaeota archaeon]
MIQIIGEYGFSSFTNLKKVLKVSTGTIYHHLDSLSQLIEQKEDKKYYLTDLGVHAYNSLKENIEIIESPEISKQEFKSPLLRLFMLLTPKKFISFQKKDKLYNSIIAIIALSLGAILCGLNAFYTFFLFHIETTEDIYELEIISHVYFSILYIVNFLISFLLLEGSCRLLYKKKERTFEFFITLPIVFFPMVIYLLIHFFLLSTELLMKITFFRILDVILLILFQVLSLWLLTYSISVNKGLKIENGLIISLLLHWGSFSIVLFLLI